ncbi:tRNA (uridine(54)-C5)-methyltransferase TrmA [Acinetobacter sp. c1-l78]|uniref:tRNA (uridine(54)-C5)-methyltransferase TrmA n=1 Tax=Acinetobacter sp. c1-l78 TaxID=3342803 RepID=UPI0035B8C0C7
MNNSIYNSENYQLQLQQKAQHILQQFTEFHLPELEIFESPIDHYRMRAEFRIWHTDDGLFYAMFEKDKNDKKQVVRVDEFPIASQAINDLMPKLLSAIEQHHLLSHKVFEINFLNTLSGEILVSLLYHKALDDEWQKLAEDLQQKFNIKIIGRSRGQKRVLTNDFVIEKLHVNGREYIYQQIENGFSQPNAVVCEKMLTWACDIAKNIQAKTMENNPNAKNDLLELYCGNANFTLPLSQYFNQVLATELAKSSVYAAQYNIKHNHIDNIQIARLSAEEFSQAYKGEREFRRLQQQNINIADYDFSTIFVDPPRAGIDDDTLKLMAEFEHIIYISCNPDTLLDNLKQLTQTHQIQRFALFDQFPYTHHAECGVLLSKLK